jgi:hypothetical protein
MRVTTPARPQDRGRWSATGDVCLRAKTDHQHIRDRVWRIGRSDRGAVIGGRRLAGYT